MKRIILIITLIGLSIVSLFVGVANIGLKDLFDPTSLEAQVFVISRIPRLMSILVTGIGMSVSGLIMQQLTNNKFVSPSTAVTVDAAKLGLIVSMLFFSSLSIFGQMFIAFGFSLSGTFLFIYLLRKIQFKNAIFIPLLGIMLGNLIDSITTFLGYRNNLIQDVNAWMVGNFSMVLRGRYELLYISIPLVIIAFLYAKKFTVAGMGEEFAKSLGLNYKQVMVIGLTIVALITSTVVITVGSVPFLGLIIPNIVSLYRGDNMKETIWDTALLGSTLLLLADIISRTIIYPYEIPIGLTIGIIGSGIFIFLLYRRQLNEG